jgi:hypothetical protein
MESFAAGCEPAPSPAAKRASGPAPFASPLVAVLVGLGLIMGGYVKHALLDLGIAGDLGELLPPASGRCAPALKHDGFRMMVRRDVAGVWLLTRNAGVEKMACPADLRVPVAPGRSMPLGSRSGRRASPGLLKNGVFRRKHLPCGGWDDAAKINPVHGGRTVVHGRPVLVHNRIHLSRMGAGLAGAGLLDCR